MKTSFRLWLAAVILICAAFATAHAAPFTPGNLAVVRFDGGGAALTSAGTVIFIDEYTTAGVLVQSILVPPSGSPQLVVSGTATSEGALMRSPNGLFLCFAGYNTQVGTLNVPATTAAAVPREVARMDANGVFSVAASTATQFSASNIRSGASDGLNNFWGSGGNSGTYYFGLNAAPATVQNAILNTRVNNIQNGNLYFSTGSGTLGIYAFTGTPTVAAPATLLIATGTGSSPYGFAINPSGTVAYVADDRAAPNGGIQRWNNSGGTWFLAYTLGTGGTVGARSPVVDWSGANPVIYATTSEATATPNRLIRIVDTGPSSPATTLATVGANRAFRGVAFAPGLLTPQAPEYFSSANLLPPPDKVYVNPFGGAINYGPSIRIQNVRHRQFTPNYPPPSLGNTQMETFSSVLDFDLSTDGGATFSSASGTANVTVQVTHSQDASGTSFFNTEMVQLDLVGGGIMLRESPTLQSTGQTTIRPISGGNMISSFFDIFTEVSLDNGLTWTPASNSHHVEMRPDPKTQGGPVPEPTPLLPPPNDGYVSPDQWHALYAQGIVIKDVSHDLFTTSMQPPTSGGTNIESFNSQIDMKVSLDGGNTYQVVRVAAPVQVKVINHGSGGNGLFDTEMVSLNLTGLQGGLIMIRESPTEPSRGITEIQPQADGTFRVNSFFDIFTELSVDGGQTWSPATNGPVRMQLKQKAPEVPAPNNSLPVTNAYVSPEEWHALYASGIIITNVSHDQFLQKQPPPPPGATNTENFGSRVTGKISMNGGASFQPFSVPNANVAVTVGSRSDLDTGNTRFFDTEMTSLSLSGGTLPGGVMIRESPTKQSLGKTSVRSVPADGSYRISSFFDVFTELSLDNGQTWSPSISKPGTMAANTNTPANCVVSIICPANITVVSSIPVVVNFTVTASDTCGLLPTIISIPPSGSIFPIGTTTVTNTATDVNGSATCTFTVTVQPPASPQAPEYFATTDLLPPPGKVYVNPFGGAINYGPSIRIKNVRHRQFTPNYPPPALGTTVNENFSSTLDFDLSTDGGATFASATGTANVTVKVTHSQDAGGTSFFNTEMLQLDLVGGGIMLRESPTLQSTGQTTIRPVTAGNLISSFFDIFTEVSTDGGLSWTPASNSHHVELRPDPKLVPPVKEPTKLLPPPGGAYVSPQQWHALYAQGIVIKDVSHRLFTGSLQPPPTGGTNTHNFNSQLDLQVSTDGGNTFQSVRVAAPVQVKVASAGSAGSNSLYDTEMLSLDLSGLPNGIMIRESPTLPSRGMTEIDALADGTYRITSFFDVFTELSLDGGASWSGTTNGPVRVQLVEVVPEGPKPTPNLPPLDGSYISPAQWHALYANGIIITNASHDRFTQTQPPPPPGGSQTHSFGSRVTGQISMNGGASFQPFQAPADVAVQVSSRADQDTGSTRFFDTEMLSLNLSGGSLPGGVMVRESPSKASLGRTSVRTDGTAYQIGSFFDVFTEVSLDGGATWTPSVTKPGTMGLQTNTPNPVLTVTCPSNITVTATGPSGAVVFFTVTTSGGCPPVNVVANPPSGSTFPIGTTTVTSTASDTCGNSANCSFTITVLAPQPTVPEYFKPTNKLPPTNSVYISPAQWHLLYASGIIIRDVRHRFFTQNFTPPPLGQTQIEAFGSEVDFDVSTDNGLTFQPASGTAAVTVKVTHSSDSGGTGFFDTEMLQLDLTTSAGGSLLMIRESPTLASTGQTTIRPVAGGYMISSFFDVFTELSTDGGISWQPAQQAGHVEMRPDPKTVVAVSEPTTLLPPQKDKYVSPEQWHALYAQGIVIKDVSHKLFTTSMPPPASGNTNTENFNSQVDMQVSMDGGNTFQFVRAAAPVQVSVASHGSPGNGLYDTEMTGLSANLPNGVMIRESPTEPSRGMTEITAQADGTFRVNSFFDIFTELSLDGGASWSPATNGPVRMQLTQQAPEVPTPNNNLPVTNAYVSPSQWHALYANGIIITNASHDLFTQRQPPPPPGLTNTENFGSRVTGQISLNGGASFQPFSVPNATVSVAVGSRSDLDTGNTRFFDTEMLSLNLQGGTLPGGVMVRESPTKQSLGKTSVRTAGTGYQISSFFDVFTEVSLDGGATWSPSVTAAGTMSPSTNVPVPCVVSITCPPSITVTSVGPAVVTFLVTASDTCNSPVTIISVPPSGSTFPIGTTTVTNTASSASGAASCTFTVTVKPKPRVFPSGGKLPPTNSVYISPAMWHAAYANGIYISNVVHRAFTANFPPPTTGATSNETFNSKVDFKISMGPGQPFLPMTGNATCTVKVTNIGAEGNDQVYQTEMLQLDLNGGTLPPNVRLRESPTLQSTGQTRITPSGTGAFQISSFFDIWTELSTDGGQTWMPSSSAGHMELHIDPANPPTMLAQPQFQGTHVSFNIPTQPGLRYTVQYNSDLTSPDWSVLITVSGNGQNLSVPDPLAGSPPHRFYRVVIEEDPNQ